MTLYDFVWGSKTPDFAGFLYTGSFAPSIIAQKPPTMAGSHHLQLKCILDFLQNICGLTPSADLSRWHYVSIGCGFGQELSLAKGIGLKTIGFDLNNMVRSTINNLGDQFDKRQMTMYV
jgi:hypothetical protein